ncbi:ATP binding, partial [Spiromyces aspiralis]
VTEKPQSEGPSRLIFDAPEIECGTNDYLDDSSSSGDDDSVDLVIRRHESISTNGSWRYIPGTRASSLRRKPTRTRASRPTTELIANNLDDFFPDHDLDKPIVQSVRLPVDLISLPDTTGRVPPSMFPTDEINIVMDEDDDANTSKPIVIGGNNGDPNDADPQVGHSIDAPDVSGNSGTKDAHFVPKQLAPGGTKRAEESGDIPVTRRKSLRMLVRESRNNLSSMRSRFDFLPPIPQSHRQGGRGKDRTPPPSVYPGHAVNVRTPPHIISTFNRSLEDRPTNPMSRRLGVIITNPNKDNRPLAAALASTSIQPLSPLTNESSGLPPYSAEVQSPGTSGNWSSTSDSWNSADHKDLKTPTFLRRSSTKMWGGIPQEIRPKRRGIARIKNVGNPAQTQQPAALYHDKNIAAAVAHPSLDQQKQQQADSTDPDKLAESLRRDMSQQEIVRRALSLLQKPDHSPQDEQRIIETAIKQGLQNSTVGTRRQFTEQQAKWDRRQRTESMNSTVQALFGAHGPPSAPIKIQWLKGKRIGKGSFGQVHIALNALNGEIIAVKQIRIPSLDNANKKRRNKYEKQINQLYSEIGVLKDIEHENIVQYLGFDVSRSMMNIFLEYVPGGTVRSLTKEYGPLAEPVVNSFLQQILAGLEYLHSRNILHRDIKGANILVTEQGVCKISDFGISKKTNQSRRAYDRHTRVSSNPEGTVFWMAPEAARSERFSAKVDVWSLGCVTIEMWTGQRPWVNMDETQVIFRLAKTSEPPPLPADITEDGNDFCKHCLQPNPDD